MPKGRKPEKTKPEDFFRMRYGMRYQGIAFARHMQTAREISRGIRIRFKINAHAAYVFRNNKALCSMVMTCEELPEDRHKAMMEYIRRAIIEKEKDELFELPGE